MLRAFLLAPVRVAQQGLLARVNRAQAVAVQQAVVAVVRVRHHHELVVSWRALRAMAVALALVLESALALRLVRGLTIVA